MTSRHIPSPREAEAMRHVSEALYELLDEMLARRLGKELVEEPSVYFIQAENGGPIKIGVAKDVEKRRSDLQRTSPFQLRILLTVAGGFARERELHAEFAEWRLHGEWFDADCPGLKALIPDRLVEEVRA